MEPSKSLLPYTLPLLREFLFKR